MKNTALILMALVAMAFYAPSNPPDLIAYYSFDQCDARDDSGNGSDGFVIGSATCHCGIEENGLLLDGRTAYVEFHGPVNRYFTTSDFTLSFYIRPLQFGTFPQSLISKRSDCGEENILDLFFNARDYEIETEFKESAYKYYGSLSPYIDTTTWLHFALVREGTRAYTYINGSLRNEERRCSGIDISNEAFLSFSHSPCVFEGKATPFKGVIDELKVFSRALSEKEVASLYALHPVEHAEQDCLVIRQENYTPERKDPDKARTFVALPSP